MQESELKQIPLSALFIASGIVLPPVFHLAGLGATFLPMFLPVLLGGMVLTWRFALLTAVLTPLASWLLTGMPPVVPPVLPVMLVELSVAALLCSVIRVHLRKSVWLALVTAILADRLVLFLIVKVMAPLLGWNHPLFSISIVISGLPGIVLQLIIIPWVMKMIKSKFPQWYHLNNEQADWIAE